MLNRINAIVRNHAELPGLTEFLETKPTDPEILAFIIEALTDEIKSIVTTKINMTEFDEDRN